MEIPAWTQKHFQKPLTVNTVHCAILKMDWGKVENSSVVRWTEIKNFFLEIIDNILHTKEKSDDPAYHQHSVCCIVWYGSVLVSICNLHICIGTIILKGIAGFKVTHASIQMRSIWTKAL